MIRLLGPGVFGLALFALWVYAVLDVIATDSMLVRNLPKTTWLMLVIFVPSVGAIAWIALGRPPYAGWRPGDTETRPTTSTGFGQASRPQKRRGFVPLEDREDWLPSTSPARSTDKPSPTDAVKQRRLMEWEAELERREQALGDSDDATDGTEPPSEDSDS